MKKLQTKLFAALTTVALAFGSTACASTEKAETPTAEPAPSGEVVKVKVGITGSDTQVWDFVAEKAAKENIEIEILSFSDYVQPNLALAEGELDINAFQTVAYFDAFIKEHNLDLVPLATTVLAPMGVYSDKITSIEEIPDGAQIAVPDDVTNQGRALLLLQEAGVITLKPDFDGLGDASAIVENPKNIEIIPMAAAQTPRALQDVTASVINNGVAVDAGFAPLTDSIFHEEATATPYVNIIAARAEDKDNATLKRICELYQEDDVIEVINQVSKGASIPTFLPLENIGW